MGILMLDTRFPRIPGDMANAETWDFPVRYGVVRGASPEKVVLGGADGLLDAFVETASGLVAEGVSGITTTCGFLSLHQQALSEALPVPVLASSLAQVAMIDRLLGPGRRAGILTIAASSLTSAHLEAAGVPDGTPVGSTEGGRHFTRAILTDAPDLDPDLAEADNVEAARALAARHPEVGAIVLECTNMTPYAAAIRDATGLPVYSIFSLVSWFRSGLAPRKWRADA